MTSQTNQANHDLRDMAVVVIGRNEGERLKRCIASVRQADVMIVYVDSGSTDGSASWAQAQGVTIVELDMSKPFSAARARNRGFERVRELKPNVAVVQFVDGDCEFFDSWLARGREQLLARSDVAAICGRVRERHPEASRYNRLCDLEWTKPIGEVPACGGIFMIRAEAFAQVEGFNDSVVAGEEPEMCLRLRREGWKILSVADDMVWHDAAMARFGQWWKRQVRGGYAYAMGRAMHGRERERFCVRQSQRIWLWACWLPLIAVAAAWFTWGLSVVVFALLYVAQTMRIALHKRRDGFSQSDAWLYATFTMLAKWPQLAGQVRFYRQHRRGDTPRIIEYKGSDAQTPTRGDSTTPDQP